MLKSNSILRTRLNKEDKTKARVLCFLEVPNNASNFNTYKQYSKRSQLIDVGNQLTVH